MSGKVIQGSFVGQPRWSPSIQPKIAAPANQARTAVPPPTAFAGARTGVRPAFAARQPGPPSTAVAARPTAPPASAFAGQAQPVQRHGAGGAFAIEAGALGIANGGGKPLPDAVRGKMEAALGADFSGVRVHVGPQAERIGAIAFTTGSDIYFAPGRYQPETIQGQQLLGHELAHVVQQRAGRVRNPLGSGLAVVQDRALEAEADRMGSLAARSQGRVSRMPPSHQAPGSVQRRAASGILPRAEPRPDLLGTPRIARSGYIQKMDDEDYYSQKRANPKSGSRKQAAHGQLPSVLAKLPRGECRDKASEMLHQYKASKGAGGLNLEGEALRLAINGIIQGLVSAGYTQVLKDAGILSSGYGKKSQKTDLVSEKPRNFPDHYYLDSSKQEHQAPPSGFTTWHEAHKNRGT